MTEIKICGMTCEADIEAVNACLPDYVGFVLFFPKSKRNLTLERARELKRTLDGRIQTVAVVVSPTLAQVKEIEKKKFDFIQIHGALSKEVYESVQLPILRAFNVTDLEKFTEYETKEKIVGYVFDSKSPGSGRTFDWSLVTQLQTEKKVFLAGGIDVSNVSQAIYKVAPDAIDVSSSVEMSDASGRFCGKDPKKIRELLKKIRDEQ